MVKVTSGAGVTRTRKTSQSQTKRRSVVAAQIGAKVVMALEMSLVRHNKAWLILAQRLAAARRHLIHRGRYQDIVIVSYPHSGAEMIHDVTWQICGGARKEKPLSTSLWCIAGTAESVLWQFQQSSRADCATKAMISSQRCVLTSHSKYRDMLAVPGRFIYVVRNGLDVALSLYYGTRHGVRKRTPFKAFYEDFVRGNVPAGNWYSHVTDWACNMSGKNVLFISYDEFCKTPHIVFDRIAMFCDVSISYEVKRRIISRACDLIRNRSSQSYRDMATWHAIEDNFVRKATVGEWRGKVSKRIIDEYIRLCSRDFVQCSVPDQLLATDCAAAGRNRSSVQNDGRASD